MDAQVNREVPSPAEGHGMKCVGCGSTEVFEGGRWMPDIVCETEGCYARAWEPNVDEEDYRPSRMEFYEQEQARLDREKKDALGHERLVSAEEFGQEEKPSNPKDLIGSTKLAMTMVPFTALAHWATAHMEGNVKYGRFNWRAVGVRSSIYLDAALRHLMKYTDGEDCDPETRVHHLASVMACCAIILDAGACGKLTDDRPPSAPTSELVDKVLRDVSEHLKELHADKDPYHYTIDDTREDG